MEQPVSIPIKSLQHTGIPVRDIRRSVLFYEKLGFRNVMEAGFEIEMRPGTCIMMERASVLIELYELPEPERSDAARRNDGHIDHIAFDVDDIDYCFQLLKDAGFAVLEPSPVFLRFWKSGCKYFNITGPDGERLEFNQIIP